MNARQTTAMLAACLLAACVSHDGLYSPACAAYAGSKIELRGGRFSWDKYTDTVMVDDDGRIVDQFPGFPLQGTYRIDGDTVHMRSAAGETLATMYLRGDGARRYLLTAEQFAAWQDTGKYADCALLRGGHSAD